MNELEIVKHDAVSRPALAAGPIIDIPGVGLKRDYAGILEYWQMARRHKGTIIVAIVAGGLLGFLMTLSAPRVYQSRLTVEIQGLNDEFLNMRNMSPTSETSGSSDVDLQTHVKILQSKLLVDRVRLKLNGQKPAGDLQPADRLGMWRKALKINPPSQDFLWQQALGMAAGSVRVRSSGMNRVVDISCDSTSGQVAADFCNTLAREYIEQNLESRWAATEHTGEWLTNQLRDLKINLEKSEEELQAYAQKTGLVYAGEKNDTQETILADLQKELSSAQADRITKQSKYEMAAASPPGALPEALDDESMKTPQSSLAELQGKLAQLRVTFTPNHTEVRRLEAQIAALQASVQESRANIMTRIHKEFEGAQRREALLTAAYTGQARAISGKAEETAHYSLLKREVDASRLLYENLLQKLKESSIASALRANNIRVVDGAERPGAPYKPDVSQRVMLGLLAGMVLGVGFVVLREQSDRTLQDPGDSVYHLGLPELGVVPIGDLLEGPGFMGRSKSLAFPKGGSALTAPSFDNRVEMVSWRQKNSLLAESYRTTLTSILFSRQGGERPRVLVFTSASPKEGKTTTVSNLAIALAEINHSVLVIDADMRRPRLHAVFGVKNQNGLSDLLLEKNPIDAARLEAGCAETSVSGLYVLPSGASRRSASSLLHSARLAEILSLARDRFDTVIVDTPPMVNIADARVVARFGDATILVVRSGSTTRDAALLAKGRFAEDGIPILGTILNFWNPKTPGYAYYRYYYAGYLHYYGDGHNDGDDDEKGDDAGPGGRPIPVRDLRGRQRRATPRPQLQFLTSVEEAVVELERQGTPASGQS
jgi:succinoglycan biosynthesis transport protein ExoP